MNWAIWAALAPLFWAMGVLIDQYVARTQSGGSPGRFVALIGLGAFPFLPLMLLFNHDLFALPWTSALGLIAVGAAMMAANYPYMLALQNDDASIAVPLFQAVPVFTFFLAWAFLGETVNRMEILGAGIIIVAAVASVWDFHARGLKRRTFLLMMGAGLIFASAMVSLRFFSGQAERWQVVFWEMTGFFVAGAATVIGSPGVRRSLFGAMKESHARLYLWGWLQNTTEFFAQVCLVSALAAAPSAGLATVFGGLNPFYTVVLGTGLSFLAPDIYTRAHLDKVLAQKLVCAVFLLGGLYVLLVLGQAE